MHLFLDRLSGVDLAARQLCGQLPQLAPDACALDGIAQAHRQFQIVIERVEQGLRGGVAQPADHVQIAVGEFAQLRVDALERVRRTAPLFRLFSREPPATFDVADQFRGIGLCTFGVLQTPMLGDGIKVAGQQAVVNASDGLAANLIELPGAGIDSETGGQRMLVMAEISLPQARLAGPIDNGGERREELRVRAQQFAAQCPQHFLATGKGRHQRYVFDHTEQM